MIPDEASLAQAAANHFNWFSPQPSCFLSVFSDKAHARNWARDRQSKSGEQVYITQVFTSMLPTHIQVFKATSFCERLSIFHRYSQNEVIFLHRIPWQSLGRTRALFNGTPKQDVMFLVARLLQELNDSFGHLIERADVITPYNPFLVEPSVSQGFAYELRNLCGKYRAFLGAQISVVVEQIKKREGSNRGTYWDAQDPFRELFWLLGGDEKDHGITLQFSDQSPLPATEGSDIPDISGLTLLEK